METALDALPAQPLTAEDVATLNESATVRLIPYTWYGEQVIAILLLHDTRDHTDETAIEDATEELESEVADDEPESDATDAETNDTDDKKKAFGTHQSNTVGTVEVIDDGSFAPDTEEDEPDDAEAEEIEAETTETKLDPGTDSDGSSTDAEEELHVYTAGYDDSEATWVVIAEIDPDTEFTDAEPLIREWISDTYHDQIVDRLAVGPSEYEVEGA